MPACTQWDRRPERFPAAASSSGTSAPARSECGVLMVTMVHLHAEPGAGALPRMASSNSRVSRDAGGGVPVSM